MRCINCNETRHVEGARFCYRCGAELQYSRDIPALPAGRNEQPQQSMIVTGNARPAMRTFRVNGVSFDMILVEGGTFYMGITPRRASEIISRGTDWRRLRGTELTTLDSFYIAETPVTQSLWMALMGKTTVTQPCWQESMGQLLNPSQHKGDGDLPVENVDWNDCQEFIANLNAVTDGKFRLPTDAEWEFAARGGNSSRGYEHAGGNLFEDVGWYEGDTHRVRTKKANELGIYDMSGNIREWCQDGYNICHDPAISMMSVRLTPDMCGYDWSARRVAETNPEKITHRMVRGYYNPNVDNILIREVNIPSMSDRTGFRLAI